MKYGFGVALVAVVPLLAAANEPTVEFARDVAPILQRSCIGCHGPGTRTAGLDLHDAALILRGTGNGPVIVRGASQESVLIRRVREGSMPPGGKNRLSESEIAVLERWIDQGAPGAGAVSGVQSMHSPEVKDEDRAFWSFRVLRSPRVPAVRQEKLIGTPVDAFLLQKLEQQGLTYTNRAGAATLARRAHLDLLGLPPTPGDVSRFAQDNSPEAFARLVDQLLESPHFGERWGRHWLDLAGYVDTVGRDVQANGYKIGPGRWRYRDYVIRAFNQDKPFDQFLIEQLAGDELFDRSNLDRYTPEQLEKLIATGFLRTAEDPTDSEERDNPLLRYEVLHQTMDILASSVMGLTVGCARCHDHKFDPISQKDYYSLMAVLAPAYNPIQWTPVLDRTLADVPPSVQASIDKHNAGLEELLKPKKQALAGLFQKAMEPLLEKVLPGIPEKDREAARKAALTAAESRNARQKKLVAELPLDLSPAALSAVMPAEDRAQVEELKKEIQTLEAQRRSYRKLEPLYDTGAPPEVFIHRRGDHESKGPTVSPAGLAVLSKPGDLLEEPLGYSSGRRFALAKWLTSEGTPAASLVARVYVNRVWMHLFGEPLAGAPDNFGKMGGAPTHPELLEWLSSEFIRSGWSTKQLIRTIMLSRAYQSSSMPSEYPATAGSVRPEQVDPDNTLLWRMRLRRLESEVIRDSILAIAGTLNAKLGGPPVPTITHPDGMVTIDETKVGDPDDRNRRSIYLVARRRYNLSLLGVFDHPVMSTNAKERGTSAVVLQSLMMLNDKEVLTQARQFAERVAGAEANAGPEKWVDSAYLYALSRRPDRNESEALTSLLHREKERSLKEGRSGREATLEALASVCHVILNANEFLYVN